MSILFQIGYFLLPAALANMTPVFVRNWFKELVYPLDFYARIKGERVLGDHKTFRGLIFGIITAIVCVCVQDYLYRFDVFKELSVINYTSFNPLFLGFLIGFGVLFGDAAGSFFKRRLHIAPGKEFIPVDQIDSPIFLVLFLMPFYPIGFWFGIYCIIAWFFGHLIINYIGWMMKIKRNKF